LFVSASVAEGETDKMKLIRIVFRIDSAREHALLIAETGRVIGTWPVADFVGSVESTDAFVEAVIKMADIVGIDHVGCAGWCAYVGNRNLAKGGRYYEQKLCIAFCYVFHVAFRLCVGSDKGYPGRCASRPKGQF
jgi:hypothetical protein